MSFTQKLVRDCFSIVLVPQSSLYRCQVIVLQKIERLSTGVRCNEVSQLKSVSSPDLKIAPIESQDLINISPVNCYYEKIYV